MSQGSLHELLRGTIDMNAVRAHLDALASPARIGAVTALSASEQAALYEAARGFAKVSLEFMVPSAVGRGREVVHHGRNSLPAFRYFQKRFHRPEGEAGDKHLWGYNHNPAWLVTLTGPGYFVAYEQGEGEVLIDYTRLPPFDAKQPPGWPKVLPNSARLSRFIYNGTQDTLRGVSAHVTIGRAARAGKDMPNWFVLCRED